MSERRTCQTQLMGAHGLSRPAVRLFSLAIIAVLVAMMVFVWLQVARTLRSAAPPPTTGEPASLVWGDRVFQTETQLQSWVEARGISYSVWAARHRGAVAVIEHRVVAATSTKVEASSTSGKVAAAPKELHATTAASAASRMDGLFAAASWALVLLLGAAALVPRQLATRVTGRELGSEPRIVAAGGAVAMGLGLLMAGLAS
jgi:hypothetical protein